MNSPLRRVPRNIPKFLLRPTRLWVPSVLSVGLLLLASSVLAQTSGAFNGCKNVTTGVIRLLPSSLPPPLNTQCNTTATNSLLRETPISWHQRTLESFDQLAGLPCTSAIGTANTIKIVGPLPTPICANAMSRDGRFLDLGAVIIDAQTRLVWEKKTTEVGSGANLADLHDVDNRYDWFTATGNWIAGVNAEGQGATPAGRK